MQIANILHNSVSSRISAH